jgi:hypothetical protein
MPDIVLCPWCANPLKKICDNAKFEAFGCEPCKVYVNRAKPTPAPGLTPVSQIEAPREGSGR